MSISNLFTPNNYTLYCNVLNSDSINVPSIITQTSTTESLTVQQIQMTNTRTYNVKLTYFTGSGYTMLLPTVEIKTTVFCNDYILIEIPEMTVSIPGGVTTLYLSESTTSTEIAFPFDFKYTTQYAGGFINNTVANTTNSLVFRVFSGNNSPISIFNRDGSDFPNVTNRIIPALLPFIIIL